MTSPKGLGRRKTAIARVKLLPGETSFSVNSKPMEEYFTTVDMRTAAKAPLVITNQVEKYGVAVKVSGGGKRSQADAVKLAVARALLEVDPNWRKQLKTNSLLTRDPRMKERKKFGLK